MHCRQILYHLSHREAWSWLGLGFLAVRIFDYCFSVYSDFLGFFWVSVCCLCVSRTLSISSRLWILFFPSKVGFNISSFRMFPIIPKMLLSAWLCSLFLLLLHSLSPSSRNCYRRFRASQVAWWVKEPPANAGDVRDASSIPGSGRCPGGGRGNQLQYSRLKNPKGQRSLVDYSP